MSIFAIVLTAAASAFALGYLFGSIANVEGKYAPRPE
jgi:hypothetical protein